ncbi:hypothetical protein TRVA0_006S01464 [Trichomonascus vanleenenianus]|uniref:amidase n=1 Tax=Trichomonascus vanleenenianus TaxID=2268995 RepID=UPI003ECAB26F
MRSKKRFPHRVRRLKESLGARQEGLRSPLGRETPVHNSETPRLFGTRVLSLGTLDFSPSPRLSTPIIAAVRERGGSVHKAQSNEIHRQKKTEKGMPRLRIAVVQLDPRIGQLRANIERATRLVQRITQPVDLVVLPEFALTGYNFQSRAEISPFLETPHATPANPSVQWASQVSKQLNCHTVVGYPEKHDEKTIYNSAVVTLPDGAVAYNYRKAFLYDTDVRFGCSESPCTGAITSRGDPFPIVELATLHDLRVQLGICMDLNPYQFKAPFDAFEFARSAISNNADVLVCPMAWLHHESPSLIENDDGAKRLKMDELKYELDPDEIDLSTVNYWALRSKPLLVENRPKRVAMICANRCGWEDDILYAGSSSVFVFTGEGSEEAMSKGLEYHGSLAQMEEAILYREVEL